MRKKIYNEKVKFLCIKKMYSCKKDKFSKYKDIFIKNIL